MCDFLLLYLVTIRYKLRTSKIISNQWLKQFTLEVLLSMCIRAVGTEYTTFIRTEEMRSNTINFI